MSQEGPKQIPMYEVHQTHYPYVNIKQNLFNQPLANLRSSMASVNPFATRQVPSQDRMALGFRWGNQFYSPNPYPNGIFFTRMFPQHYDPLSGHKRPDGTYQDKKFAPAEHGILAITADKLPRGCVRQIDNFKRCEWVNGSDKCQQEQQDIINVCPNWALDEMKQKTRLIAKINAIQNITYRRAMEVPEYNKGRTVADVTDRTWIHGTRLHLRPDTIYPDERYADITQQEINEAKKRVAARRVAQESRSSESVPQQTGAEYVKFKREKPLYP